MSKLRSRLVKLSQKGSMPAAIMFGLFLVFVFALIGTFKSATIHASADTPDASAIKSGLAGYCLDVKEDNTKAGATVDAYSCNNSAAQSWSVQTIAIHHDDLCLAVTGDSQNLDAPVTLEPCDPDSPGQVWLADHGGLYNPNAKACLVDPNSSTGVSLVLGKCDDSANEQWSSPMLILDCTDITGEGAKVACYAESDFETWQSGTISHESLLTTYTGGAPYEEWCADFVSYVYKQAGYAFTGGAGGWDQNNANLIQAMGFNQQASGYTPVPGDVGYFNYTGGHVEIVISGGKHPTFIYGNSATIDPTTGNGEMESNTIVEDGSLGSLQYYLTPAS